MPSGLTKFPVAKVFYACNLVVIAITFAYTWYNFIWQASYVIYENDIYIIYLTIPQGIALGSLASTPSIVLCIAMWWIEKFTWKSDK